MDPIAGLLSPQDRRRSRNLGLLSAGLSLMADSGWSTEPQDTLSNVARAGLTGLQAYMGSNERALEMQQYRQAQLAQQQEQERLAQMKQNLQVIGANIGQRPDLFDNKQHMQVWNAEFQNAGVDRQQEMIKELQEAQTRTFELDKGDIVTDRRGNVIAINEEADDPFADLSTDYRDAIFDVMQKPLSSITPQELQEAMPAIRRRFDHIQNQQRTSVNVEGARERSVQEDALGASYQGLLESADTAIGTLNQLSGMKALLDSGQVETGWTASALLPAKQFVSGVTGFDVEGLPATEVFNALGQKMTLDATTILKGAISDREIEFVQESVPNLSLTLAGNRQLIDYMERMERRKIEMLEQADQYLDENGTLRGFTRFIASWAKQNPLFPEAYSDIANRYRSP